jgi:hypothetical protein
VDKLQVIEHKSERVLTTAQIAELENRIKKSLEHLRDRGELNLKRLFCGMNQNVLNLVYAASQAYGKPLMACVYFIKNKYSGLTKIGATKKIERRFAQLVTAFKHVGMPADLSLSGLAPTYPQYLLGAEKFFHNIFNDKRMFGEWFDITDDMVRDALYEYTQHAAIIDDVYINYTDFEYYFLDNVNYDYGLTIEDMGYVHKIHVTPTLSFNDLTKNLFRKTNKLHEIVKSAEKHNVGFYELVPDEHDYPAFRRSGIKHVDTDEWYSFGDIKTAAFDVSQWQRTISKINRMDRVILDGAIHTGA